MKKFTKASTVLMLTMAMIFTFGCKPEDDPNGEGGSEPTTEGIYLGVIGFNYNLYTRNIGLLNSSTQGNYISFIEDLEMDNLTGLYYADYTALQKLQSYSEPPKLTNVALVTFTDGLDNASLDDDKNPENYPTRDAYLEALHNKIKTEKVHGKEINAYTIGLKGNDVQDVTAFRNNLQKLASSNDNVFEVTSMDEAIQRFAEIAESLHSINTSTSLSLLVPPGYDDGLVLRFTFDWIGSAENSSLYLECTYKRTENGRRLDNITYHGFKQGATSLSSVEKLGNGFYKFVFENLKKEDNSFITESDKDHLKLYRQIPTGWEPETEFDNNNQSSVTEEHSSALIMLVLDCTTSLGNQFSSLKRGATRFVETLVSSTGGGNNGGGNGGGDGNGTYNGHDYVDLGLPSGTLWATCNVGATTPEGYGDYFAWGETTPKTTYNWSTYRYCNGDYDQLTKYCNQSSFGYNGFTDNLTTIQPTDDAAMANWSNGWCMPTYEQWEELYQNTSHTWTTQNGTNGRLFTASTGNSLFLPAAGFRSEDELGHAGSDGTYWSSSLDTDSPIRVQYFHVDSRGCYIYSVRRYSGLSVRPVRSARQN